MHLVSNLGLTESICRRHRTMLNALPQALHRSLTTQQLLIILNFTPLLVLRSVIAAVWIDPNLSREHTAKKDYVPSSATNRLWAPTAFDIGWLGSRDSSAIFQTSCLLACCVDTVDSLQIFTAFGIYSKLTGKKRHEKVKLHVLLQLDQGYSLLRARCDWALKWLGMTGRWIRVKCRWNGQNQQHHKPDSSWSVLV